MFYILEGKEQEVEASFMTMIEWIFDRDHSYRGGFAGIDGVRDDS